MSRFAGMELTEHPRVTALVMCDRIIVEEGTQKKSLIDLFTAVRPLQLPATVRLCNELLRRHRFADCRVRRW